MSAVPERFADDRVVVCWIPDWPVIVAAATEEGSGPLAVIRGEEVVACSEEARAAGVRRRMRLRSALSRCPGLRVVERDLEAEVRQFETVVGQVEDVVMPRVEVIRPGLLAGPVRGPSRFWGGEEAFAGRLAAAVAEAGHPVRVGIAGSVFTAALAARKGEIVPAGQDAAWLAHYPVGVLGLRDTELLHRLGISSVGAFAALPGDRVASRFGLQGRAAHRTARGLQTRPLAARAPGADYSVERVLEPAEARSDALAFVARALADELHQRLAAAAVTCARVEAVAEFADGRTRARVFRHEGRLSALAVADRIRGILAAWTDPATSHRPADLGEAHGVEGVVRLALRPEGLVTATGQQDALVGERLTPVEVERAASRVQALLGHRAVTRAVMGGGRAPGDRITRVPFGEVPAAELPAGPWPGAFPAPHPAVVFAQRLRVDVIDERSLPVVVGARLDLTGRPAFLSVEGRHPEAVSGWAGPWPVLEQWWDRDRSHRLARIQVVTTSGNAWLLAVEGGQWWAEGLYG
ncbi:DNA polymerase Y family protein [Streptomyces sp. NPDC059611]|uniref:DNA polymerase Y family protein n=1 Tax=Streptomyces sp. NPDC059611 TaxID=3346884 RepID=UPI003677DE7F